MKEFFGKIGKKIREQIGPVKKTMETTSKSVSETTSKIAGDVAEKSRDIAEKVSEKAPEIGEKAKKIATDVAAKTEGVIDSGRRNLKLVQRRHDLEKIYGRIGSKAYELHKAKKKDLYANPEIEAAIQEANSVKEEIASLEKSV
jgi:uncharacterized protein YoxC